MLLFKKLRSLVLCLGMLMVLPFSTQGKEPHSIDEKALIEIKNVILEAYDDKFREDTLLNTLSYLFNIIDTNKDGVTSEEIQFAIQRKMAKKRAALLNQVDPPPVNWSISNVIIMIKMEKIYEQETLQTRRDCFQATSG